MKIKCPKEISVLIHPYTICLIKGLKTDEDLRGECNIRTQQIGIDLDLPDSQRVYTLLHEVYEAYNDALGLGFNHETIDASAIIAASFLLNNLGLEIDWSEVG